MLMIIGLAVGLASGTEPPSALVRPVVAGYFVHDDNLAWQTLEAFGNRLAWVITTNYLISDATGALRGDHDARAMGLARRRGAEVHFRVSNLVNWEFDRNVAHAILTGQSTKPRALADILAAVDAHGYDGVNIDLEKIPPADRAALTAFMRDLRVPLRTRGKTLSIAVPGKTSDDLTDPSSGAFDLRALGSLADRLVIMAYDEHWDTGPPGPVASLPWVEAVVRYALTQVAPEKVLLGVALYGYDWPLSGPGEGISMREAVRRSVHAGVPILWDERAQVPYFRTRNRIVYFENDRSLARKLDVRARAGLLGIATWRLGHELPEVWDLIGGGPAASTP
jgi:spore germination protein